MEGKIAVLGKTDFVMPFSSLGLDTFAVEEKTEQISENARQLVESKYTLIIVEEDIAKQAEEIFATVNNLPIPAILIVPFTAESSGYATKVLGELLKTATGINILLGV
jgi:vacuolar-type H+-ATPase subunit F/Vma7